ncbi:MAG: hypothetical protein OEM59_11295 [Rhodospirillales bacterium]|nr:hypothetical protein [Rhodospirillales bacterium]
MHGEKLLYPVLGTGSFFALFLVGYVRGHEIGLHPLTGAAIGLVTGCAGVTLVSQLERLDSGG